MVISERFEKLCGINVETELIEKLPYKIGDLAGESLEVQALQKNVFKVSGKLKLVELFYLVQQTFVWPGWDKDPLGKKRCGLEIEYIHKNEHGGESHIVFGIPVHPGPEHIQKTFDLLSMHGLKFKERV